MRKRLGKWDWSRIQTLPHFPHGIAWDGPRTRMCIKIKTLGHKGKSSFCLHSFTRCRIFPGCEGRRRSTSARRPVWTHSQLRSWADEPTTLSQSRSVILIMWDTEYPWSLYFMLFFRKKKCKMSKPMQTTKNLLEITQGNNILTAQTAPCTWSAVSLIMKHFLFSQIYQYHYTGLRLFATG